MLEIPFVLRVPPVTTRPIRTLGSVIITVFYSSFAILLIISILTRMRIFFEMCGIFPVVIKYVLVAGKVKKNAKHKYHLMALDFNCNGAERQHQV